MAELYPLKFHPQFKEKIWGGRKIESILQKNFDPLENCGESWELSAVDGNISMVKNGGFEGRSLQSLLEDYGPRLVGTKVYQYHGNEFPLLIKFIDAQQDLSVQVHPNDELAAARHGQKGKTEMWYIMQADEGASLIAGLKPGVDGETFRTATEEGNLEGVLNRESVYEGDVFFIPAGRVHTIGKGILLAEIQQTSDITYRIYDFDRVDQNGQKRELHLEEASEAIDYSPIDNVKTTYPFLENQSAPVVSCEFFTTNIITANSPITRNYAHLNSFVIYICIEGNFRLECSISSTRVDFGDVVLIPAELKELEIVPDPSSKILEVYIE